MIEVTGLRKTFRTAVVKEGRFKGIRSLLSRESREKVAVNDISFRIAAGEFVGYIGPNGAGKSTTIKMLTGILHPTAGEVLINGRSPQKERRHVVRQLGVVFGQRSQLWWDLPVRDSFDILAAMYRIEPTQLKRRLGELRELLALDEFLDTPVRRLSLGQRMRGDLAAAMLHDPDLLFLDEPMIGLDVVAKKNIRSFLKTLNRDFGKTILLTTHDMDDIEQLCERVMVINYGELAYDGTVLDLRARIGLPTRMRVTFHNVPVVPASAMEALAADRDASGASAHGAKVAERQTAGASVHGAMSAERQAAGALAHVGTPVPFRIVERTDHSLSVECNRQDVTAMDVLRTLSEWGDIDDVHMEEPDFEEVIHRVY